MLKNTIHIGLMHDLSRYIKYSNQSLGWNIDEDQAV